MTSAQLRDTEAGLPVASQLAALAVSSNPGRSSRFFSPFRTKSPEGDILPAMEGIQRMWSSSVSPRIVSFWAKLKAKREKGRPSAICSVGGRRRGEERSSTSGCCHLPGSLCDYSGNTESDASKDSEESDSTAQAQYIAKVTAKDGRPLSTVVKAVSLQSDVGMCRICHEGAGGETLLSPCDCTGTLGKVHKSCLEKWLSSSNTSYCELCHTEFTIERRPQPLTQWLKDPGPRSEKRTLLCDMACFLLITPLAAISGWLCLRGAQDHLQLKSRLEAVGLIALTIALFTIYILWTLVSFRYHCQLYSEWRRTNQKVRLLMPDMKGAHTTQRSVPTKSTKKMTDETIV
ncbi:E3 ubiquitin-protein ligase MARCH2-like protein [Lates japonicus]|uniref:E3 ubiquitin-protein ligase MARCHF2 n=2 Tax=Percomorphaceae TaxID=1489872 RepID=A0AAD3R057_LATJO|nr:E3 ubiquitin-protein ligase MARCH2-like protein [Lates japonicus]